jgi:hypothetical protein
MAGYLRGCAGTQLSFALGHRAYQREGLYAGGNLLTLPHVASSQSSHHGGLSGSIGSPMLITSLVSAAGHVEGASGSMG